VKRIPTQVGAPSSAMPSRRARATGAAEARTGRASATKAGQAPAVVCRFVMPYIIIGIMPKVFIDPYGGNKQRERSQ
jgi:hypothetical protein